MLNLDDCYLDDETREISLPDEEMISWTVINDMSTQTRDVVDTESGIDSVVFQEVRRRLLGISSILRKRTLDSLDRYGVMDSAVEAERTLG